MLERLGKENHHLSLKVSDNVPLLVIVLVFVCDRSRIRDQRLERTYSMCAGLLPCDRQSAAALRAVSDLF